jgi:predicted small lipoprotein YifL
MRNRLPAALLILLSMLLLTGCGQKGPLYLPEPEQPEQPSQASDEPEQTEN